MQRESATWRLTRKLGTEIVRGDYSADAPFPREQTLSETHEVSRSVIRETIKILSAKGLIVSRPKVGLRVRPRDDWNFLDPDVLAWISADELEHEFVIELLQMRRAVEPMAAALAAEVATDVDVFLIEEAFNRMRAAEDGLDDPLESDVAFHRAVLNASGNRLFAQLGSLVSTALRAGIRYTNRVQGRRVGKLDEHERILSAIKAQHRDEARHAAEALLDAALATVLEGGAFPTSQTEHVRFADRQVG